MGSAVKTSEDDISRNDIGRSCLIGCFAAFGSVLFYFLILSVIGAHNPAMDWLFALVYVSARLIVYLGKHMGAEDSVLFYYLGILIFQCLFFSALVLLITRLYRLGTRSHRGG